MYFSKIALFAIAAYGFSLAGITGNVVDESGAPVKNAAVTVRTLPNLLANSRTPGRKTPSISRSTRVTERPDYIRTATG